MLWESQKPLPKTAKDNISTPILQSPPFLYPNYRKDINCQLYHNQNVNSRNTKHSLSGIKTTTFHDSFPSTNKNEQNKKNNHPSTNNPSNKQNKTKKNMSISSQDSETHTTIERRGLVVPMNNNNVMERRIRYARCLMGLFRDSETFTRERIQAYVDSCWYIRGIVDVEKRGTIFLFHFSHPDDMDDILARSPLNVNGAVLLLSHWVPNTIFQNFDIPFANFWMQLHGVPAEFFSEDNIRRIARIAGTVSAIDWNSENARALRSIRVLVRLPVHEPIVPGVFILTPERTRLWVSFRYEKIFRVCYHCGRIGHSNHHCEFSDAEAITNYVNHLRFSNFDQRYEMDIDYDAHLYNHWIRGLPNSDEHRNTMVLLFEPLEINNTSSNNEAHATGHNNSNVNTNPAPQPASHPTAQAHQQTTHPTIDTPPPAPPTTNQTTPSTMNRSSRQSPRGLGIPSIINLIIRGDPYVNPRINNHTNYIITPPPPTNPNENINSQSPNTTLRLSNQSSESTEEDFLIVPLRSNNQHINRRSQNGWITIQDEIEAHLEYQNELNQAMQLSLDLNQPSQERNISPTLEARQERFYEDWDQIQRALHRRCDDTSQSWNSDWDFLLNHAGYESDNETVNQGLFFDTLDSNGYSSQTSSTNNSPQSQIQSNSDTTNWVTACSNFFPSFFAGFVVCKSQMSFAIDGVVAISKDHWKSCVAHKIKNFTNSIQSLEDPDTVQQLSFGPWTSFEEFPSGLLNLFQTLDVSGAFQNIPDWILDLEATTNFILCKINSFQTMFCRAHWSFDYYFPEGVGMTVMELLFNNLSSFENRALDIWEEEINLAKNIKTKVGDKRKRPGIWIIFDEESPRTSPKRRRQRPPAPDEAGSVNWEKREEDDDMYESSLGSLMGQEQDDERQTMNQNMDQNMEEVDALGDPDLNEDLD